MLFCSAAVSASHHRSNSSENSTSHAKASLCHARHYVVNGIGNALEQEARESVERDHILRAPEEANWNVSGAARALGMERTNLHKRIRALGISRGK